MKRYELYNYSGFEWLGETPSHWKVLRMCYMFKPVSIKNTSGEINLSVYRDYGVIPTNSRDDNHNVISEDTSNYKLVEEGDFVMNKMKCWMGSLGLSDYRGIVSPSYTVMKPLQSNNHKYTHYLLRSKIYIPQYKRLSYGVREGQWDLRFEDFRELPCLIPPLSEQQQIVSFLDTKTSHIDSLIEKTQRKIELLKEKKTSLISEVVTKGLNRKVKMKDSGVEWIGDIPDNWNWKRMCYMFKPVSIKNTSGEINLSVYRDYGVIPTNSRDDNHNVISEDTSNYKLVNVGDFVMNKMKCWMGSLGLSDYRGIVSPSYTVMKPLTQSNRKYLHYLLRSQIYIPQYRKLSYGVRIGQWDMRFEDFRELPCLIPPLSEQQEIVEYLDVQTEKIDKTSSIEKKRIQLLKEYRQSLISEVVTGKRKVVE